MDQTIKGTLYYPATPGSGQTPWPNALVGYEPKATFVDGETGRVYPKKKIETRTAANGTFMLTVPVPDDPELGVDAWVTLPDGTRYSVVISKQDDPIDLSYLILSLGVTLPPADPLAAILAPYALDTDLAGLEPALGNPPVDGYHLTSTADGVRTWVAPPSGGGSGGVTQDDLDTAIETEATAREAGDTTLAENLADETVARETGDANNAAAIATEVTDRTNADNTLLTNINTRALQSDLTTESTNRAAGDAANATALTTHTGQNTSVAHPNFTTDVQTVGDARYVKESDRRQLQTFAILHGNATTTINPANANTELATAPRLRVRADLRPYTHMRVRAYISALTGTVSIKVRHCLTAGGMNASILDLGISVAATAGQWVDSGWLALASGDRIETWLVPCVDGSGGSIGITSYHIDVTSKI